MSIYSYMHIYMYIYIDTEIHARICTRVHIYIYIFMPANEPYHSKQSALWKTVSPKVLGIKKKTRFL